jgi:hypothetical protein
MSKTGVHTLIATGLLGVLLFVILQFARDMQTRIVEEPGSAPKPGFIRESRLPRITTEDELLAFLGTRDIDPARAVRASLEWQKSHGFLGRHELFGVTEENSPDRAYESLADDALASMSEQGDLGATQALASGMSPVDPVAAMALYELAASQGSIYALLQIGSLRETFADMAFEKIRADAAFLEKLGQLTLEEPNLTLHMSAFAYAMAAVRQGGVAVVNLDLLAWIQRMAGQLTPDREAAACAYSGRLFVEYGRARRARGLAPITTDPPAVFIGVPDLADRLPCRTTTHPVIPLLDIGNCSIDTVENALGETVDLYICQN